MRRRLVALGILLLFLGLVLISNSSIAVQPEPDEGWRPVEENLLDQSAKQMSVEGYLESGDKFRVYFSIDPPPMIMLDAAVSIDVIGPNGSLIIDGYEVDIVMTQDNRPALADPFPEGVADQNGTYKVNAKGLFFEHLSYLSLQKFVVKEKELEYPYRNFLPVGVVAVCGGVGISLYGSKIPKGGKTRLKKHSSKRKR